MKTRRFVFLAVPCALLATIVAAALDVGNAAGEKTQFQFPQIAGHGGVVQVPNAVDPPRKGTKIIFDITADSPPDQVHKGLENLARYLNLNAQAGLAPEDVKLAAILHGQATKITLNDEAFARQTQASANPNLELMRQLKQAGVELLVCGQSLARNNFATADATPEVTIAVSAMTANANKQADGYAYIAVH
jgi:intracellular sulfur oxidation DsrE/DsrF family protein